MEQTSDLLNTGSHMETGTTADQEYMWSVVDLYEQMAGKSLGNGKARAGVTIGHLRRLWTFKKARKLGYKLHSPWLVRHPISVIFFSLSGLKKRRSYLILFGTSGNFRECGDTQVHLAPVWTFTSLHGNPANCNQNRPGCRNVNLQRNII